MKAVNKITVIAAVFLIAAVAACAVMQGEKKESVEPAVQALPATSDEAKSPTPEMRGLWVSYISLDMGGDTSYSAFKAKLDSITDTAKEFGCNALFVQVRPFSDAMYESKVYPASHVLSGKQGVSPGYDALEYMCTACKSSGLQLHAWINPYRVATAAMANTLSDNNPYIKDPSLGVKTDTGIYLNPAKKEVRDLIVSGVTEIVENYPVDGIHFDDYFYPECDESFDRAEYSQYQKATQSNKAMSLDKWRQSNVNLLIARVYREIKSINNSVQFGISPQGNISNCYGMGADVKSWVESTGYVDYICPQLYFSVDNPALSFGDGLQDWVDMSPHPGLKIYAGLGVYKAGTDADSGTWESKQDNLASELSMLRRLGCDGYILYDYGALCSKKTQTELEAFAQMRDKISR